LLGNFYENYQPPDEVIPQQEDIDPEAQEILETEFNLENHVIVKEYRTMQRWEDFKREVIGIRMKKPYIQDTQATHFAGKHTSKSVVVPFDYYFKHWIDQIPEGDKKNIFMQKVRAVSTNKTFTLKQKKQAVR